MPITLQPRSVFKYLLAGLFLSLLVLSSEALPTQGNRQSLSLGYPGVEARAASTAVKKVATAKKAPAKKTPAKGVSKAPRKAASKKVTSKKVPPPSQKVPAKVPAGKKVGASCPIKRPAGKKVKRSLYRREVTSHPSGASSFAVFHGDRDLNSATSKAGGIDMSKTSSQGDYHRRAGGCEGGFYLADSLFAAAQFVCHHGAQTTFPTTAYVNEYMWTPPAGLRHKAYTEFGDHIDEVAGETDCRNYDLLEGPMNGDFDKNLHKDFYQYTITNQKTAAGLVFTKTYTIPCANVAKGKDLDSAFYQQGQKRNPGFTAYANALEGRC